MDEGWGLNCKSAEMGKCLLLNPLLVFACESLLVRFAPYFTLFSVCKCDLVCVNVNAFSEGEAGLASVAPAHALSRPLSRPFTNI